MPDPITTTIGTAALLAVIGKTSELLVAGAAQGTARASTALLRKLKRSTLASQVEKRLDAHRYTKTLWSPETAVAIESFFVAPTVIEPRRSRQRNLDDPAALRRRGEGLLVLGTIGQGKSILMRHLAVNEPARGRIPILIELRSVGGANLLDAARDHLRRLGFGALADQDFRQLLTTGGFSLLLDGLDEVTPSSQRSTCIASIEQTILEYPQTLVIVSARPGTGAEHASSLKAVHLGDLDRQAIPKLIKAYSPTEEHAQALTEKIKTPDYRMVIELLSTPLMVALLVIRFRENDPVPKNQAQFYENLFELLVARHDRLKPAFNRKRNSDLSDKILRDLFEVLCFRVKRMLLAEGEDTDGGDLARRDLVRLLEEECVASGVVKTAAESVLGDIINVTSMVLQEQDTCRFLHRSVLEYHVASFIRSRDDETAARFYRAMRLDDRWQDWAQELAFLIQIDPVRFREHFAIPTLDALLAPIGANDAPSTDELVSWATRVFGQLVFMQPVSADRDPGLLRMEPRAEDGSSFWLLGADRPSRRPRFADTTAGVPENQAIVSRWIQNFGSEVEALNRKMKSVSIADLVGQNGPGVAAEVALVFSPIFAELRELRRASDATVRASRRRDALLNWD